MRVTIRTLNRPSNAMQSNAWCGFTKPGTARCQMVAWRKRPRIGGSNSRLSGTASVNEWRYATTRCRLKTAQTDIAPRACASASDDGLADSCDALPWSAAVGDFANGQTHWLGGASRFMELAGTYLRCTGFDGGSLVLVRSCEGGFSP